MSVIVKLKYKDGVFVPLTPVSIIEEGDILEFRVPDPGTVFLCETDRLAALDRGQVILVPVDEDENQGANYTDA